MARVVAYPVFKKQKSVAICEIFLEGVPSDASIEGNVFYGVTELNFKAWSAARSQLRASGKPYYYIDNSYFDKARDVQYRVSKNSLQFKGPRESDGSRFAALGYELKPWRSIDEGHIVVCVQSPTFMRYSLGGGAMRQTPLRLMWIPERIDELKRRWPGREIRVREWSSNKPVQMRTLHDDLKGAGLLVTHSSAAAVEAVIEGVPVIVDKVSALAELICSSDTGDQRLKFLNALADNQWTLDEIKNGSAWRWLNR